MKRLSRLAHTDPPTKRVGLWLRVSTEDQANGESLEHHEVRGRAYADLKGWHVTEVYRLQGVSGKAIIDHPDAVRMLRDIERGHITGLIFSKLARLARNTKELLEFAERFRQHDADLISLQESIDTSTPAGRLFYTMIAAMAQWEREEIASRVAASVPVRARLGKPLGGAAPFGFKWEGGRLLPDAEEAPVRRLMYDLFLKSRRKKTVARELNSMGYRTRAKKSGQPGSLFSDTTVDRLLRDPTAKGLRRANYTKSRGANRGWDQKPESDWIFTQVESIVSPDLWQRCNQILDEQRAKQQRVSRTAVQLFGGLTWCACGAKMYVVSTSPKYVCNSCRNKLPIEDLEAVFCDQLKGFLLSPEDVRKHLEAADQGIGEKQELLAALERELEKLRQEMDQVYRLYVEGQITPSGFGERYGPLETRQGQLRDELPRLQAEIDVLRINLLSSDEVLSEAQGLFDSWPHLDHAAKRTIIENLVERVTIGKDDIDFDLYFLPVATSDTHAMDINDGNRKNGHPNKAKAAGVPDVPRRSQILATEQRSNARADFLDHR